MITRKTLARFGCHAEAVKQFAREAGLEIEGIGGQLAIGDWVRVEIRKPSLTDLPLVAWTGQIVEFTHRGELATVDFKGRPLPSGITSFHPDRASVWVENLVRV